MHFDERFTEQTWEELKRQWQHEEITIEQLNGRLLVWIGHLYKALVVCQSEQDGIAHSVADLNARVENLTERLT